MQRSRVVAAILLIAFLAMGAHAQQAVSAASLSGTAEDPFGAPVPNAVVTLRNVDRNTTRTALTDTRGRFRFPLVEVGDYDVTIAAPSLFADHRIRLAIGSTVDVPIRLQVIETASVNVAAAAPLVETARSQVSSTIAPEEVRALPLNGRNYLDLALLAPGVSRTNTGANQRFAETSAVPGTGISVSTQRNLANSFLVDGLSANDDAAELAGTFFSQEVIREFAVIRAGGSAEFGRASGGIVNIATQSGTNVLRGTAYAFVRNGRLDADNALTDTKLPLDQDQYGISVSGPIVKDRTFFFSNAEQLRQRSEGVITISDASIAAINAKLDSVGYLGPRIATGSFPTTLDSTNVFARADHMFSPSDQLAARFNSYDVTSDNARSVGGLNAESRATDLDSRDLTLAASNLWTFSASVFSETRAQMTRSRLSAPPVDLVGPAVSISGVANFGTATVSPTERDIDLYQLVQTAMWLRSRHAVKAGIDFLFNRVTIGFPGPVQGAYTFTNLPNFLAGRYASYQQAIGETDTHQTNPNFGVFIQDEWRPTNRLTVNAGLRYDVQELASLVETDTDNISPRLGISWDVRGDGRSVIRVAAGMYYSPLPLRAVSNALQRNGVTYRIVQVGPDVAGAPAFPNTFAAAPAGVRTNITTIDPDMQNSRSDQAAIQYERQFGAATSASIGYEHLRGHGIIMSRNINVPTTTDPSVPNLGRPDPRFANNTQFQAIGDSWYHGLTVAVTNRPIHAGSVRLSYTLSKGIDTSGNFFFSQPQNANDIEAERGRSDNDQRHRLALSGTLAARGWLFSLIFTHTSALPFNIQVSNDRNGDTNFNDRPPGVGRNTGEGFDYQSLDLRLSRTFAITRDVAIETMIDAFNVLNRANYQVPNNIVTSPTFGQPTAVNDPRQMQVGLRLIF